MTNRRRYAIGGFAILLVLILYYVIDYAVVSNNVRKHVESVLSTTIKYVGSMQPSDMNYLAPSNARKDTYINFDNKWLVVNPNNLFVSQQIQYNTWQQLNQVYSSPISLVTFVTMSLVPLIGNTSVMVSTDVRFVGPFGIPRTISVIETQPIKEFAIQ